MARADQSLELFKTYSVENQDNYLNGLTSEIDGLQGQSDQLAADAAKFDSYAGISLNNASGVYDLEVMEKTGELQPKNGSMGMAIIGEMNSANAGPSGGNADLKQQMMDSDAFLVSAGFSKWSEEKEQEHQELEGVIGQKKEHRDLFEQNRNAAVNPEALNSDLDGLYKSQSNNYQEYLNTQAAIERKKHAIEVTSGILFARTGKMEEELKALQDKADRLLADFIANDDQVRMAAGALTPDQMERFDEIADKMAAAMRKAKGLPEPPPVPEPPQVAVATPVVQQYVNAGTKITCPFAMGGQSAIVTDPSRKTMLEGPPMANIMDFKPMVNIPTFGMCNSMANPQVAAATAAALGVLTPQPCVPNIVAPWAPGKADIILENAPVLLSTDTLQCLWGGRITILPEPPQPPMPPTPPAPKTSQNDLASFVGNLGTVAKGLFLSSLISKLAVNELTAAQKKLMERCWDKLGERIQAATNSWETYKMSHAARQMSEEAFKAGVLQDGQKALANINDETGMVVEVEQRALADGKKVYASAEDEAKILADIQNSRKMPNSSIEGKVYASADDEARILSNIQKSRELSKQADDLAEASVKYMDEAAKAADEAKDLAGKAAKMGKMAKGAAKYLGPAADIAMMGIGYALEDTSNYATSVDDAYAKHADFEGGSVKEWGEVIADYGVGFYKDQVKGTFLEGPVTDSVINFGGYVVRDTAETAQAVVEIKDYLGEKGAAMGAAVADYQYEMTQKSIAWGAKMAEDHPAPAWLINIFG